MNVSQQLLVPVPRIPVFRFEINASLRTQGTELVAPVWFCRCYTCRLAANLVRPRRQGHLIRQTSSQHITLQARDRLDWADIVSASWCKVYQVWFYIVIPPHIPSITQVAPQAQGPHKHHQDTQMSFSTVLSFILVGACWGCTTPFIKDGEMMAHRMCVAVSKGVRLCLMFNLSFEITEFSHQPPSPGGAAPP